MRTREGPLRILAVSALWQGANDYAFVRAFRRAGHSVTVVQEEGYVPLGWRHAGLRALRRLLRPALVFEYNAALAAKAAALRPHLFFVFKGSSLAPGTLRRIRRGGAVAINIYPDVSITAHGPYIPRALPHYDWIFTTKTFGLDDMARLLGVRNASFLPHAFDPETHVPTTLDASDIGSYGADVAFMGTWSPKKERLLREVRRRLPDIRLRIWGSQWERAAPALRGVIENDTVTGTEYAKAIAASAINLGLLSEARRDASSGDLTTARTFEIPAAGGFMLHERTAEAMQYFAEGEECAFFSDAGDLVARIAYYLGRPDERRRIAAAGRRRCLESGYSIDARAATVLAKYDELRAAPQLTTARSVTRRQLVPSEKAGTAPPVSSDT